MFRQQAGFTGRSSAAPLNLNVRCLGLTRIMRISIPIEFKSIVSEQAVKLGGSLQGLEQAASGVLNASVSLDPENMLVFKEWFESYDFDPTNYQFCSFCGRERSRVTNMIRGTQEGVFICNECVVLCSEVIAE